MSPEPIVIVAARRTPIGAFQGALAGATAPALGAAAIAQALIDSGIDAAEIDQVLMGCVLPAGLGQAPARQAACARGRDPGRHAVYDGQQDVRLRNADDHARA